MCNFIIKTYSHTPNNVKIKVSIMREKEPERPISEAKKVHVSSDSKKQVANVTDAIFRNKKDDKKSDY